MVLTLGGECECGDGGCWGLASRHMITADPSETNLANKRQWPTKGMSARREFCICERFLRFQFKISAGIREVRVLNGF